MSSTQTLSWLPLAVSFFRSPEGGGCQAGPVEWISVPEPCSLVFSISMNRSCSLPVQAVPGFATLTISTSPLKLKWNFLVFILSKWAPLKGVWLWFLYSFLTSTSPGIYTFISSSPGWTVTGPSASPQRSGTQILWLSWWLCFYSCYLEMRKVIRYEIDNWKILEIILHLYCYVQKHLESY